MVDRKDDELTIGSKRIFSFNQNDKKKSKRNENTYEEGEVEVKKRTSKEIT